MWRGRQRIKPPQSLITPAPPRLLRSGLCHEGPLAKVRWSVPAALRTRRREAMLLKGRQGTGWSKVSKAESFASAPQHTVLHSDMFCQNILHDKARPGFLGNWDEGILNSRRLCEHRRYGGKQTGTSKSQTSHGTILGESRAGQAQGEIFEVMAGRFKASPGKKAFSLYFQTCWYPSLPPFFPFICHLIVRYQIRVL